MYVTKKVQLMETFYIQISLLLISFFYINEVYLHQKKEEDIAIIIISEGVKAIIRNKALETEYQC